MDWVKDKKSQYFRSTLKNLNFFFFFWWRGGGFHENLVYRGPIYKEEDCLKSGALTIFRI